MISVLKRIFLSVVQVFCFVATAFPQNYTLSGYVRDQQNAELLVGVQLYIPRLQLGTSTNNYGFYSLTVPKDSFELIVSNIGYSSQKQSINLNKNTLINFSLKPIELEEVKIIGQKQESESEKNELGTIQIPLQNIKTIPGLLGEKDPIKIIQLMPGVQKGAEGNAGLYVRGGGQDQNLILVDEVPLYNPMHLFGFVSFINVSALRSISMQKGGFPAQYGGRLSSVVEVNLKDGNKERVAGEASMGLVSAKLSLEGPIRKGKSSWIISGRRSYIDLLTKPFLPDTSKVTFSFYDLNAKVSFDINAKNKILISTYLSGDAADVNNQSTNSYYKTDKDTQKTIERVINRNNISWGNKLLSLRWNREISEKWFSTLTSYYSEYKFDIKSYTENNSSVYNLHYSSGILDLGAKYDLEYISSPKYKLRVGAQTILHRFSPSALVTDGSKKPVYPQEIIYGQESALYAENEFKLGIRWKANLGLRLSHFYSSEKHYLNPEPRFLVMYRIRQDLSLKAAYSFMTQYMHLIQNTGSNLPTDIWVPATEKLKPQNAHQVSLGLVKDFNKPNFFVSIEGFYKKMNNILGYKEGASYLVSIDNLSWKNQVTPGQGWSYGAEFLLQRKQGKLTGWVGYTLSWTVFQFDAANAGKPFYAKYDRRHDVSIVGNYKLNNRITLSATWVYATGNRLTLPVAYTNSDFDQSIVYTDKNSFVVKPYHRLDIGVQFYKKLKKNKERIFEISIYNVYNRFNTFYYFIENFSNYNRLKEVSLFPILPSVSYTLKF